MVFLLSIITSVDNILNRRHLSDLFKSYAEAYQHDATNPRLVKIAAVGGMLVMPFNVLAGAVVLSAPSIGITLSMLCHGISRLAALGLDPEEP